MLSDPVVKELRKITKELSEINRSLKDLSRTVGKLSRYEKTRLAPTTDQREEE